MDPIAIDVWSDVVCPWCYLGKRRLERALAGAEEGAFFVRWHAFQLQPDAPRFGEEGAGVSTDDYLLARGLDPARIEEMQARLTGLAAAEGLEYRLDLSHHVNTRDAHVLVREAVDPETAEALVERLFQAQLMEGRRIDDPEVLDELATEVGLIADARRPRDFAEREVDEDLAMAGQLRISGVPFFVLDRRLAVSGAQDTEVFAGALARAVEEREAAA